MTVGLSTRGYLGSSGGGSSDATPPTIIVISPTPGVARGQIGGFPSNDDACRVTPIVLELADDVEIAYVAIFGSYGGARRVPVFRSGAFEPGYQLHSTIEVVDPLTTRLHVRKDDGWELTSIVFTADVVDGGGNVI